MALVNGSMTAGSSTNSTLVSRFDPEEVVTTGTNFTLKLQKSGGGGGREEDEQDNASTPYHSNVHQRHRHHYRLFGNSSSYDNDEYEEETDSNNPETRSSTLSFLEHMNRPSPSEIRQWMADTQETVGKVVTNWQQELIDRSSTISDLLGDLIQFVVELESGFSSPSSSPPVSLVTAKCLNKHGAFESVINVYLHLILISLRQVAGSVGGRQEEMQEHPVDLEHLKKRKREKKALLKTLLGILAQFSMVAEDALRFLQTHRKILGPACEKVLEMRNTLYHFLRQVIEQPQGQIIPLLSNVSLERIRMEEDVVWMRRTCEEYKREEDRMGDCLEVDVHAKDCFLEEGGDMTVNERLELILLLLKQLDLSIGSISKACRDSQNEFILAHTRLMTKFQRLVRDMLMERKQDKLSPENCSEKLKASLCQLEVRFHQVEKILEEIPQHLKRVVGVADQCSRTLIQDFGLLEEHLKMVDSSWTSPIEDLSEEFFKSKRGLLPGCFPFLWRVIARVFFGGDGGDAGRKVREFWEEVRTEMEDFQKEIKVKEMETGYGVVLKVPIVGDIPPSSILAKYIHKQMKRAEVKEQPPVSVPPPPHSTETSTVSSTIVKEFKYVCQDKLNKKLDAYPQRSNHFVINSFN